MLRLTKTEDQSSSGQKRASPAPLDQKFLEKWDAFVEAHPLGSIYHLSGWKEVIEESFKHIKSEIITIWNQDSNEIIAGLPVYYVDSIITGKRYVSAPFANFCEPLTSHPEETKILFDYLVGVYDRKRPSYIEVRARPDNRFATPNFVTSTHYLHHFLPLDASPEMLFKKFHKKAVRVPILKAANNNLLLKPAEIEDDVLQFYQIYFKARKNLGLPSIPYKFFQKLWEVFYPSRRMQLILCAFDHNVIGASILLKFKEWVFIEYGHDLFEYRKLCVNHFLDWETIKLAYHEGFKFVSFGRTSLHNSGLIVYKNHWGTTSERLLTHYYPKAWGSETGKQKEASWQYRLTRQLCARSPRSVYELISAFVYRHLG